MTLVSSRSMQEVSVMSDEIATEDIVQRNDRGQMVVVVAKGQRIPQALLAEAKKVDAPAENKARKPAAGKGRKA